MYFYVIFLHVDGPSGGGGGGLWNGRDVSVLNDLAQAKFCLINL